MRRKMTTKAARSTTSIAPTPIREVREFLAWALESGIPVTGVTIGDTTVTLGVAMHAPPTKSKRTDDPLADLPNAATQTYQQFGGAALNDLLKYQAKLDSVGGDDGPDDVIEDD
jgi:hypothetical protein